MFASIIEDNTFVNIYSVFVILRMMEDLPLMLENPQPKKRNKKETHFSHSPTYPDSVF